MITGSHFNIIKKIGQHNHICLQRKSLQPFGLGPGVNARYSQVINIIYGCIQAAGHHVGESLPDIIISIPGSKRITYKKNHFFLRFQIRLLVAVAE
ncbi:hypothetical protein D9M68_912860 [compost metagenome]